MVPDGWPSTVERFPVDEELQERFGLEASTLIAPPGFRFYELPEGQVADDRPATAQTLDVIAAINQLAAEGPGLLNEFAVQAFPDTWYLPQNGQNPEDETLYQSQAAVLEAVGMPQAWNCVSTTSDRCLLGIIDTGLPIVIDPEQVPADQEQVKWKHVETGSSRFIFGEAFRAGLQFEAGNLPPLPFPPLSRHGGTGASPIFHPIDENGHGSEVIGVLAADLGSGENQPSSGIAGANHVATVYVTAITTQTGQYSGGPEGSTGFQIVSALNELSTYVQHLNATREAGTPLYRMVVNISWGGSDSSGVMLAALQVASAMGLLIVASTGNKRENGLDDCGGHVCAPAKYVSQLPNSVVAVGEATLLEGGNERFKLADWSNWDPGKVTVVAPGTIDVAPRFKYQDWRARYVANQALTSEWHPVSGTSYAAPLVAAALSLYWSQNPDTERTKVIESLTANAISPQGETGQLNDGWGHGMLDAKAMLCSVSWVPSGASILITLDWASRIAHFVARLKWVHKIIPVEPPPKPWEDIPPDVLERLKGGTPPKTPPGS